jgi:hypothetical protein
LFRCAVTPAVIVRQRKPWRRKEGTYIYFEDNAGVIVNPKGEMKGEQHTHSAAQQQQQRRQRRHRQVAAWMQQQRQQQRLMEAGKAGQQQAHAAAGGGAGRAVQHQQQHACSSSSSAGVQYLLYKLPAKAKAATYQTAAVHRCMLQPVLGSGALVLAPAGWRRCSLCAAVMQLSSLEGAPQNSLFSCISCSADTAAELHVERSHLVS